MIAIAVTPDPIRKAEQLLDVLERTEPAFYGSGTPQPDETEEARELIAMGPAIVPHLIARMRDDVSSKKAASIALVLGRIGDARAAEPLRELCERYERREAKDEWDYAVIGQCNVARSRIGTR